MQGLLEALSSVDPIAFSIGPLSVHWYGLAYVVGFIAAGFLLYFFSRRRNISMSSDDVVTVLLYVIIGVLVGARMGYILFYGAGHYFANPLRILALTDGGMSFHGGLLGATLGLYLASRSLKISFFDISDLAALSAPIGLGLGRIANFINGELWGRETNSVFGFIFGGAAGPNPRYPSQLLEAFLEGLILFIILLLVALKKPPVKSGVLSGLMMVLYGVFRIISEFFREPDIQIGFLFDSWLTMGMLLSVPMILFGLWILFTRFKEEK